MPARRVDEDFVAGADARHIVFARLESDELTDYRDQVEHAQHQFLRISVEIAGNALRFGRATAFEFPCPSPDSGDLLMRVTKKRDK